MSILDRERSSSHANNVEGPVIRYHLACHVQPYILYPLVFQIFFLKTTQSIVFYRQMRVIHRFATSFPIYPPKYGLRMDFVLMSSLAYCFPGSHITRATTTVV